MENVVQKVLKEKHKSSGNAAATEPNGFRFPETARSHSPDELAPQPEQQPARNAVPRTNSASSYFRSQHGNDKDKPAKRKQHSGGSAFTSGSIEEDDETPGEIETARPFRGPFTHRDSQRCQDTVVRSQTPRGSTTPHGTPGERSQPLPESQLPTSPTPSDDRPSLNTRTTSANFFFQRLSGRVPPANDHLGTVERPMETLAEDESPTTPIQTPRAPLSPTNSISGRSFLGRSRSRDQLSNMPQETSTPQQTTAGNKGWAVLRNRMKGTDIKGVEEISKTLSGHELVSELTTGLLPVMMLKMGLTDRDEHGERRIPVSPNSYS